MSYKKYSFKRMPMSADSGDGSRQKSSRDLGDYAPACKWHAHGEGYKVYS